MVFLEFWNLPTVHLLFLLAIMFPTNGLFRSLSILKVVYCFLNFQYLSSSFCLSKIEGLFPLLYYLVPETANSSLSDEGCHFNGTWFQTAKTSSRFTHGFSSQKPFLLWMFEFIMRINCLQNTLALMEDNIFRCSGISEGVLALSHKIHYLQTLLAPNVDHFCLSNKCSSNTRWCDISFYLPFAETNNFYIVICILTLYQ